MNYTKGLSFFVEFNFSYFENTALLKPVLGGVAGVAYFVTGHEQTQYNRVCYFPFFDARNVFLASKGSDFSELIRSVNLLLKGSNSFF